MFCDVDLLNKSRNNFKIKDMLLIAILFPSLSFLLRGKILTAILCLVLQITLIGWLPASIWAVVSLQNARAEKRNNKLIRAVQQNKNRT